MYRIGNKEIARIPGHCHDTKTPPCSYKKHQPAFITRCIDIQVRKLSRIFFQWHLELRIKEHNFVPPLCSYDKTSEYSSSSTHNCKLTILEKAYHTHRVAYDIQCSILCDSKNFRRNLNAIQQKMFKYHNTYISQYIHQIDHNTLRKS